MISFVKIICMVRMEKLHCIRHINRNKAENSLGTLGGGNHFIELDKGDDDSLYLVIHTGSRHLGEEVSEYYTKIAAERLKEQGKEIPYVSEQTMI